jgi:hypothetical protein
MECDIAKSNLARQPGMIRWFGWTSVTRSRPDDRKQNENEAILTHVRQ